MSLVQARNHTRLTTIKTQHTQGKLQGKEHHIFIIILESNNRIIKYELISRRKHNIADSWSCHKDTAEYTKITTIESIKDNDKSKGGKGLCR
uniref:Uncharacterized protein n=1 Tax=Solanum tuberosum TaxID=4113 RepID=M1BZC9_SOLTU